ncbi:peptide chain release factor 2 [Patescibacteria group bacterium]|nr:peptide chain release factor 2 [Patescibacteria group bacterium]
MQDADFWQNHAKANKLNQELAELKEEREKWENIDLEIEILKEKIGKLGNLEIEQPEEIIKKINETEKKVSQEELKIFFSGPYDKNNVLLAIYSGAGGTEAQDWAEMLLRMYLRFAERRGFKAKVLHIHEGQEAGIKNATIEIQASFAYGTFKGESGVHRLVRLSPFNANNLRHTSFALVEVLPEMEETGEIKIKPEDLRVDTYRSSGPGGQYVNKTESAVRLTHLPTGLAVACQSERSQGANKETAMKMLISRLYQLELKKQQKEIAGLRADIQTSEGTAEWGSQIRNYVLHPYKLVKDLRTGVESKQPDEVLDGKLDEFVEAEIKNHKTKNT